MPLANKKKDKAHGLAMRDAEHEESRRMSYAKDMKKKKGLAKRPYA